MKSFCKSVALALWPVCMGLLAGCQTTTALVAGQQTNTADTALIGALNGGLIGQLNAVSLDGSGTRQALVSEYRALEYAAPGDLVTWQLPQQSLSGQVVASQPYRVGSQDCRQYTHQVFNVALPAATSAPATARGTACRNPDGSWTLLT